MVNHILLGVSRFVLAGAFLIAGLFLLSFVISSTEAGSAQAKSNSSSSSLAKNASESPNVITNGMARMAGGAGRVMDSAVYAIGSGVQTAASTTAQVGKSIGGAVQTGAVTTARGVGSGLVLAGRTAGQGAILSGKAALFVASIPGNTVGFVADKTAVSSLVQPSDHDEVPIIDPDSAELQAALAALPPEQKPEQPAPTKNEGPRWPMHGRVTTEFGVDHWPFQHTHTGIDISNGHGAEIKPFRPGQVVDVIRSNRGLGNHVVVDHGNGVTSVYAHLASISVSKGQDVDLNTTLGHEGTTGVSTGNHLHFEIRVHGQATNPRQFIGGNP